MAGKNATMLKFDMADAYKNVPAKMSDLGLQGFMWGGKFFVETRQVFGAKASVQNFDILGNTIRSLVLANCRIPRHLVHRQLDDTPVVAPASSGWCEEFSLKYRKLCSSLNIDMAKPCPNFDKAFDCSKFGKMLGIWFDTRNQTWGMPTDKILSTIESIVDAYEADTVSLLTMQCLLGKLNNFAQMCPFMNCFKHPLNRDLAVCIQKGATRLSPQSRTDLCVWFSFLRDLEKEGLPICPPSHEPPLCTKVFTSDAAGMPRGGQWLGEIGCGIVGIDEKGDTVLAFQLWWNREMIEKHEDSKGSRYGSKTATLEMVGVILPFLLMPEQLTNQHVVCRVDNMACVYGFQNYHMKGDISASILIKALRLIEACLGSTVHVVHIPRCSDWESDMADNMSREKSTGFLETQTLKRFQHMHPPKRLTDWLSNPVEDWNLATDLLLHVQEKIASNE
jgi:hypothetical protein